MDDTLMITLVVIRSLSLSKRYNKLSANGL